MNGCIRRTDDAENARTVLLLRNKLTVLEAHEYRACIAARVIDAGNDSVHLDDKGEAADWKYGLRIEFTLRGDFRVTEHSHIRADPKGQGKNSDSSPAFVFSRMRQL